MIEYRPSGDSGRWYAATDLRSVYFSQSYDAFGCLFGVRNYAGFLPIAEGRGMPSDASDKTIAAFGLGDFADTWLSWAEVKAIDWDEPAALPDSRLSRYRREPDGSLTFIGKAAWTPGIAEVTGLSVRDAILGDRTWPEGTEWKVGDSVYRSERQRRRDAAGPNTDWKNVWALMESLAAEHGDTNVRLIVWFWS